MTGVEKTDEDDNLFICPTCFMQIGMKFMVYQAWLSLFLA